MGMMGFLKNAGGGGGGGTAASITDTGAARTTAAPTTALAGYRLSSDGSVYKRGASYTVYETWLTGATPANLYQARATQVSGDTLSAGTLGSWVSLGSNQSWELSATSAIKNAVLTVEIRDATTLTVLATATITLDAESA